MAYDNYKTARKVNFIQNRFYHLVANKIMYKYAWGYLKTSILVTPSQAILERISK